MLFMAAGAAQAQFPFFYKWVENNKVAFSCDGSFKDAAGFVMETGKFTRTDGVNYPAKYTTFPVNPDDAVNLTYSPDSTMLAFTRDNNLWVVDIASKEEKQLTFDGSELILNGYASWVYYEEILGRPSRYCAFWWSPDSKKLGYYRFDNSNVPMFSLRPGWQNQPYTLSQGR